MATSEATRPVEEHDQKSLSDIAPSMEFSLQAMTTSDTPRPGEEINQKRSSELTPSVEEHNRKRCTYCFQELCEMTDPRLLPCQHIVCLTCLENDWKLDKLECRACGNSVSVSLEDLPQVKVADISVAKVTLKDDAVAPDLQCETCEESKEATSYCLDCGRLMCEDHHQVHSQLFKNDHEVLSREIYTERPDYFTRKRCEIHSSQLISTACQKCDELFCTSCIVDCCLKGGKHLVFPMATTRQNLESLFADLMKKCSDKVTELCNLEKQTWQSVDTRNERCDDMIKHVDITADKQIVEIKRRATQFKKDIANYQEEELNRVELYITELTGKAEKLEQVQMKVKRFLHQSSTSTIVSKRQKRHDELVEAHNLDTSTECDCDEKMIDKNGVVLCYRDNDPFELIPHMPRTLSALPSITATAGIKCNSLDGGSYSDYLVLSCSKYLLVYDLISQTFRTHTDTKLNFIRSVAHVRQDGNIYYITSSGIVVQLSFENLEDSQQFFTIKSSSKPSRITANHIYLAVANADGYKVVTYSISTGTRKPHLFPKLSRWIRSLAFHPDGDLVMLDYDSKISKYRLSDTEDPELVWECTEVSGAYALCVDEMRRLVYVTGRGQMLYIIEDGHVTRKIKYAGLPTLDSVDAKFTDITVCKDKLIATQNGSVTMLVFKLNC